MPPFTMPGQGGSEKYNSHAIALGIRTALRIVQAYRAKIEANVPLEGPATSTGITRLSVEIHVLPYGRSQSRRIPDSPREAELLCYV
jgi:hypothetical protein